MITSEKHVFVPDINGLCCYSSASLERCNGELEDHLTQEEKDAMAKRFDAAMSAPLGRGLLKNIRNDRLERIGGPNGPKVCAECGNGLFKLDLVNGLIVLTCSGCDEETEVPWGVLRGHLKEPE